MWSNYRDLGYRRLIFVNTGSVIEAEILARAMGNDPAVTSILLQASDEQADRRLAQREHGIELEWHSVRSRAAALRLDAEAPPAVHRINTDGVGIPGVVMAILKIIDWAPPAR
jgi:hypothetical protein